ncbi:MAG: serpin family protein [Nitrosopumilus sp.]|uniref:serpin family protein n=1 Tax=Nitrosopumilus sp. TaxID=2024843 RepID=UPI002430FBE7|nr:serpin family protein [Nitrosopumilus sp.]MCV0366361.1 serpin family protein [Nitrosopumilus sp.]
MQKHYKIFLIVVVGIVLTGVVFGTLYLDDDLSQDKLMNENPLYNGPVHHDDFVFSLYHKIAKDNKASNFFFSPFSISTAFSMVYEGARGNTAVQMMNTFDFPQDDRTRWNNISDTMKRLNHEKGFYTLEVANGIWLSELHETKPEYVNTVTTHYNGTAKTVDFVSDDGVDEINQWVRDKTKDKIQDILEPGSTDALTLLVLTNSIYFNGKWAEQFDPKKTSEESFWIDNENSVKAQMMKIPAELFNYAETNTVQILEMPYLGNDISMLIILPKDKNGLDSLEISLDSNKLNEFGNMMKRQPLTVHVPKFGFETEYDLIPLLRELGVYDAFDEHAANFAGMTDEQVFLSKAKHKAFVDVHEKGTEAAAVTVAIGQLQSGPPDPRYEFIADHPFVFVIQEKETGQILFIGRVIDPTQ